MSKPSLNDMSRNQMEALAKAAFGLRAIENSTDYAGPNKLTSDK